MSTTSVELRRLADAALVIAASLNEVRRDLDRIEAGIERNRECLEDLLCEAARHAATSPASVPESPDPAPAPPSPAVVAPAPMTTALAGVGGQPVEITREGALVRWKALPALWRFTKWTLIPAASIALERLVVWLKHFRK